MRCALKDDPKTKELVNTLDVDKTVSCPLFKSLGLLTDQLTCFYERVYGRSSCPAPRELREEFDQRLAGAIGERLASGRLLTVDGNIRPKVRKGVMRLIHAESPEVKDETWLIYPEDLESAKGRIVKRVLKYSDGKREVGLPNSGAPIAISVEDAPSTIIGKNDRLLTSAIHRGQDQSLEDLRSIEKGETAGRVFKV